MKIWACKIGEVSEGDLADGADAPMRQAVQKAFKELTGTDDLFCFSGWAGKLDAYESELVKGSPPQLPTTADPDSKDDALEAAWGIIANAHGGDWDKAGKEWHDAAIRWRDNYHDNLR